MVIFPQCTDCNNFIGENSDGKYICSAFPNGISNDVFWGRISHTEKIDGDNGITFSPIDYTKPLE